MFLRVFAALYLVAVDIKPVASHQGWGESVVPGLRGTAWKQKVASIECLGQGATSGKSGPCLEALMYAHSGSTDSGGMVWCWANPSVVVAWFLMLCCSDVCLVEILRSFAVVQRRSKPVPGPTGPGLGRSHQAIQGLELQRSQGRVQCRQDPARRGHCGW